MVGPVGTGSEVRVVCWKSSPVPGSAAGRPYTLFDYDCLLHYGGGKDVSGSLSSWDGAGATQANHLVFSLSLEISRQKTLLASVSERLPGRSCRESGPRIPQFSYTAVHESSTQWPAPLRWLSLYEVKGEHHDHRKVGSILLYTPQTITRLPSLHAPQPSQNPHGTSEGHRPLSSETG